ncbi:hypothetical protein RHSP_47694 [Rhizobium freirei PRF 81]|uniref:Tip attachment protein J domain-containing protein n=1 Tax=Rhizobium freirei PRF 81 TaxID=363754 RepID=N6V3Y2_9HYPH|nr:phage tail protein [Rhizobium freirei]ENN87816.1 hypothetical protein RHSP_47694 [Rhizobium freirei PRF 81]
MKYLILLLNVLSFWLMADAAHAGPLVAAIGAISQFVGSFGIIGKLALTVAINVGLSLIEKAMAKKDQQPAGTKLEISMGDDHAMSFIIGSYATAGKRKYAGTWGEDGKTPNAYFTDVIEIGSLPNFGGARGLTSVWIDDQKVGVLWEEPHPDGRGYPVLQYRVKGKDYLWIKFLDGTQTSPDPFLMAKFGSQAERPWRSTMIGRGCQIVILTSRYNTDLFSGVPSGLFEPHPLSLYDIRKDSSMGGHGAHRWDDRSTWERSSNPAVMIYNLARGVYYASEWVYGGQNIGAFCLPAANWMAAANACDAVVGLGDGNSEPAFRAGYDVQCDREPLDAITELLKGCNGRMAEVGGIFKMLVGAPGGAVYSFTDDDIVVTEEQDFQPFPSLSATYNAIEATYPEPAEKWTTKDAPGRYNADLEAQDGYRRLPAQVQLLAVPFANQVQRVGLAMIQDYRRFRVHQVSLPPDAYPLEPNDVVSWSSARNGYDEKKFLVVKVEPQPNFLIVVTLKEIDPADYDWHPGLQLPTAIGWLGPITPPSQPMIGWMVEPSTIKDAGGIDRRPAIKISCAPDLDDVSGVWGQVRLKETGDVVFDSDSNPYATPFSWIISGQWTLPNTNYEARGRYLPQSNRATDWSAWLAVKTPNVLIQASDVLDGAIIQSKIADAAVTAAKIMDEAVSNLKLADKAVSTAKLQVAAVTADVLASGAVIASKLADGAVTARALAQGAVDATALASSIKAVEVVDVLPMTGNVEGRQVFLTTDGKLYRYHNGGWTLAVAAGDINGSLVSSQIADAAITISKLAQGAVDATKFASGIKPIEVVDALPLAGNVEGRQVFLTADGKLYRYHSGAWTAATAAGDIAGQIAGTQVSDGAISTPKLGAGVVTADKIAANSITAGQIAAGTIGATQIAAGAVSTDKLAANSVSTSKLAVGAGVNLLQNSSFTMGTDCWTYLPWGTIPGLSFGVRPVGWPWSGKNNSTLLLLQASGPAGSNTYADIRWLRPDGGSLAGSLKYAVPCVPGEWLEATVYTSAHRCQIESYIAWVGADGTEVGYSSAGSNTNNAISGDSNNPDLWLRLRVTGAAPANAVAASILIRKRDTQAGGADSYAFINKPMLCRIPAGATEATPWSDGGIVLITSGGIVANAVTAGKIAANAVTAGTIAANAVTAGTIAAGAVAAAQIAAGAITADKLAAGSVSTQALAVGTGGNFLSNSDLFAGLTGWAAEYSNDAASFVLKLRTDTYAPIPGAIEIYQGNGNQGIEYGVMATDAYGSRREFAVRANGWYELSVYYFGHRCTGVQPYLGVFDAAGNLLAFPNWGIFPAYHNFDPQKSLVNYSRFWGKVQMPANAAKAMVFFRMKGTVAGQSDSYLWLTRMYFGEANTNQAEATPWSDESVTVVSDGNIATGAVSADKIAANAVTAGKIAAGAVTATAIAAGAVTAASIVAGTITGDKLATNTIGANQIAAGAITAKSLVLTDFSNMADNGWQTGTLDGWAPQNLQSFYIDTVSGDAAGWVLQSLGRDCARSNFVAVSVGETYAFDAWVYNADSARAAIYAVTQTPTGVWGYSIVAFTDAKNTWARLQGRYLIPSGCTKLAMLLLVDKTAGTGNSCYWSKPVMRRAVSAELIVDGAITANKMSVNSLDAISANLGAVNISSAIIGSLQVGTSNIAAGAITRVDSSIQGQAGINAGSGPVPTTGITAYHGTGSPPILVMSSFSMSNNGVTQAGAMTEVEVYVWDSGNNAYTAVLPLSFYKYGTFAHAFTYTPPAGTSSTQFRFDVKPLTLQGSSAPLLLVNNRSINALTLKR